MTQDRIAGGNYSIASCGHPVRPGGQYVVSDDAQRMYCPVCSFQQQHELIMENLRFLQQLVALDD